MARWVLEGWREGRAVKGCVGHAGREGPGGVAQRACNEGLGGAWR